MWKPSLHPHKWYGSKGSMQALLLTGQTLGHLEFRTPQAAVYRKEEGSLLIHAMQVQMARVAKEPAAERIAIRRSADLAPPSQLYVEKQRESAK